MGLEGRKQARDARDEPIIDDALVLVLLDMELALLALLVDLVLLCADEGALVDVGVHFDVGVVRELEGVLINHSWSIAGSGGGEVVGG